VILLLVFDRVAGGVPVGLLAAQEGLDVELDTAHEK
jgi:hypothetical protein